jgi:hypothetical protein
LLLGNSPFFVSDEEFFLGSIIKSVVKRERFVDGVQYG